jgi:mRNA interferase MazF
MVTVSRGDVWLCDLNPVVGSEQAGQRPALILQTDRANAASSHTIIAPFTSKLHRALLPSHVLIPSGAGGLRQDSVLLCEQIRVVDKLRLVALWGHLNSEQLAQIAQALRVILEL